MDEATIVKCEECGSEALLYTRDSDSLERANDALPFGWRTWREQDGALKYLCPKHSDDDSFAQHSGDNAIEGEL